MKYRLLCSAAILSTLLSGCGSGGSDNTSSYTSAYVQFYNGSANSPGISFYADDTLVGTSVFADASSLATLSAGEDTELKWTYDDQDDSEHTITTQTINLKQGQKSLLMLTGDFNQPEWTTLTFDREDLDDSFRLFVTSVDSGDTVYDVYLAEPGAPISDAKLLSGIGYQQTAEFPYPLATEDQEHWPVGDYVIYLTEAGQTTPIYESQTVSFDYSTEYVLAIRRSAGAIKNQLSVDMIINSTTVTNLADINSSAQFRVYNSLDDSTPLAVSLTDNHSYSQSLNVDANGLSDFSLLAYGDYGVSATDGTYNISNRLLSMNQGQSKALVFYRDADDKLSMLAVSESDLPQVYEHDLRLVNLASDLDNVNFYFVQSDQTIETTNHYYKRLAFADSGNYKLPQGYYEIVAVHEDDNGNVQLLDRSLSMEFEQDQHYLITLEPDTSSATGYRLAVLH